MATTRRGRDGSALLWAGVLTGPIAWSVQVIVGYGLEEIACRPGSGGNRLILGAGVGPIIVWTTVALMAITGLAGLLALRRLRHTPDVDEVGAQRARWMARAGLIVSGIFGFMLLLGLFGPFFFETCEPPL